MIASLSNNSIKQYNSCLRQWWIYSKCHNIDAYSASIPIIISYLTDCFEKGYSYQSLNCYRSALSLIIGSRIGTDERVKRLFKGFYRLRPTRPKYDNIWNPEVVLTYFENLHPIVDSELEVITKKTAMLLILATGQRVQTLFHIKTKNIEITPVGITIIITDLLKTSGPRRPSPKLIIPYLNNKPEICPAKTLLKYLEITQTFRQQNILITKLFLTLKRPIKEASTQTISRWLRQTMKDSGIDMSRFSAHSTRHASSSRALREGLTVDSIMKAVGWSTRSSTFANHYNRPLANDNSDQVQFTRAVLGD
jgi:integrase